eukprot:682659-Pyramimonas_sp.AAC.1
MSAFCILLFEALALGFESADPQISARDEQLVLYMGSTTPRPTLANTASWKTKDGGRTQYNSKGSA